MKTAPALGLPGTRTQPEALIKEARRRQRRRRMAIGVAVVAVLGSAVGVAAGLHGPGSSHRPGAGSPARAAGVPAPIPRSLGTTVLMWPAGFGSCCGPVAVDNLSTGRLAQSQQPAISAGDYQPLLAQVGRWLVYVGNGTTAIRDDLRGNPRVLGPTTFFAPSAVPGRVWLFRPRNGRPTQAWQVPVAGGAPGPTVTLPAGTRPAGHQGHRCRAAAAGPSGSGPVATRAASPGPCRTRPPAVSPTASTPPRAWSPTGRAVPRRPRRTRPMNPARATTRARCCGSSTS